MEKLFDVDAKLIQPIGTELLSAIVFVGKEIVQRKKRYRKEEVVPKIETISPSPISKEEKEEEKMPLKRIPVLVDREKEQREKEQREKEEKEKEELLPLPIVVEEEEEEEGKVKFLIYF